MPDYSRRQFIRQGVTAASAVALAAPFSFHILKAKPPLGEQVLGHGGFQYRVVLGWGELNPGQFPVKNCHEMVMDRKKRLIMITDEVKNNILIYDKSGKLLDSWGHEFPGGHGLSLWDANGEEFLFICDPELGKVFKTNLSGDIFMTLEHPAAVGAYASDWPFKPTETAIGPEGDIYVADGYGSNWVLQYTAKGEFIRKFGGRGNADDQFLTVHGVAVDRRQPGVPTLLCTSRTHNAFKRFTLDGQYLETLFLPGAYVCRPVLHGDYLYAGVCWSRLRYLNQTDNSGFVTIIDKNGKVVSNPGGTKPTYRKGELQLMVQEQPVFKHCHDVCLDDEDNLYVCQWNAGQTYPLKLQRV